MMALDSFSFNGQNSVDDWGIKVMSYDVLMPQKRQRRINIPFRNGSYDFGAKNYEDRILKIRCTWVNSDPAPRSKLREIAYYLSDKGKITLFDEPDKYYVGEVYDPSDLDILANGHFAEFTLTFLCEPFAIKDIPAKSILYGRNNLNYEGTAPTKPLIVIKNTGAMALKNVYITTIKEKR